MRRLLGALALLSALAPLAGCGDDGPSGSATATQPDGSAATTPPVADDAEVIALLHQTAAGGTVTEAFVDVTAPADADEFVAQLTSDELVAQVEAAVGEARAGHDGVQAAVVALGCDVPPGVTVVTSGPGQYLAQPHEVADPLPECLAPVTTVAVVALG